MKLLEKIDLTDKIVTGDAIFSQRKITSKIVEDGGNYLFPVKGNQSDLQEEITTEFNEPVSPLKEWQAPPEAGHGRIEQRKIAILPVEVLSEYIRERWPSAQSIARIDRKREHVRKGRITGTENETVWLITSFENPEPNRVLALNRAHWGIEIMHRDKEVTLGEDQYTNRIDHAPRNIFTVLSAARTVLKRIHKSPTGAIELVQNNRSKAIRILTNQEIGVL